MWWIAWARISRTGNALRWNRRCEMRKSICSARSRSAWTSSVSSYPSCTISRATRIISRRSAFSRTIPVYAANWVATVPSSWRVARRVCPPTSSNTPSRRRVSVTVMASAGSPRSNRWIIAPKTFRCASL